MMPEMIATAASTVIQTRLAYSSQNPRRRSRASSASGVAVTGHFRLPGLHVVG
jgi:hypothetical protein